MTPTKILICNYLLINKFNLQLFNPNVKLQFPDIFSDEKILLG